MKGFISALVSLWLCTAACANLCPEQWSYFGFSCYKFYSDLKDWSSAKSACEKAGGYLAEVESKEEQNYLKGVVGPTMKVEQGYWLGGKDDVTEGSWYWATSKKPIVFTSWNTGEPNQKGNEDCLHLWYDWKANWNDFACDKQQKYICEQSATCPSGWKNYNKSCYKFSPSGETKSWSDAQDKCKEDGGYLAEIESKEENDFLQANVVANTVYWFGGRDNVTEGCWYWANSGKTFQFTDWNVGEPNNAREEDCVLLRDATPANWNDAPCSWERNYVCEMS